MPARRATPDHKYLKKGISGKTLSSVFLLLIDACIPTCNMRAFVSSQVFAVLIEKTKFLQNAKGLNFLLSTTYTC